MTRKLSNFGAHGLLKLLGAVGTFTSMACGATPVYGMNMADAAYGVRTGDAARVCSTDPDCTDVLGGDWYCGPSGSCVRGARPDAATVEEDAGGKGGEDAGR